MARLERGQTMRVFDSRDGGGMPVDVEVQASLGFAELLQVMTPDGRCGVVARKNEQTWWWVRELDPPSDGLS